MILLDEGNVLRIGGPYGVLVIDDEIQGGMTITVYNEDIALEMCALYTYDEIREFLATPRHCVVTSHNTSSLIGKKKVLQTIFSSFNTNTGEEGDYKITLFSEDTRYQFPLQKEEWKKMISLMTFVTNGYKHIE